MYYILDRINFPATVWRSHEIDKFDIKYPYICNIVRIHNISHYLISRDVYFEIDSNEYDGYCVTHLIIDMKQAPFAILCGLQLLYTDLIDDPYDDLSGGKQIIVAHHRNFLFEKR